MKHVTFFNKPKPVQLALQCAHSTRDERLDFPDSDIRINRSFLQPDDATRLQLELLDAVGWRQDTISLYGKTHKLPRLHQWYGDSGTLYSWSGIAMHPCTWIPALTELRQSIEALTGARFNCVLINLYRDGNDCMGWHADDEAELGEQPVIASVSLGAERDLLIRRRHMRGSPSQRIRLNHGSLLMMAGATQSHWQHALPRRKHVSESRINLTYRYIRADSIAKSACATATS